MPFADGWLQMGDDEAWLVGDADDDAVAAAGHGAAVDSRRYGPVPVDALVGRAWLRYGPLRRIGRPARRRRPPRAWPLGAPADAAGRRRRPGDGRRRLTLGDRPIVQAEFDATVGEGSQRMTFHYVQAYIAIEDATVVVTIGRPGRPGRRRRPDHPEPPVE